MRKSDAEAELLRRNQRDGNLFRLYRLEERYGEGGWDVRQLGRLESVVRRLWSAFWRGPVPF